MPIWLIPFIYTIASAALSLAIPRIESAYFPSYTIDMSVASAQAYLSAVASGMMALTGIVFAISFVVVQFTAVAYSPRLVLWLSRDKALFHALGVFVATFVYSLATLVWIDRARSGNVPMFSALFVGALVVLSMLLFSFLVQRVNNIRIANVLQMIGDEGRRVIHETFRHLDRRPAAESKARAGNEISLGPVTQSLQHLGKPRAITKLDIDSLVRQAQHADAVIVMACAVGDTVVESTLLLRVHSEGGTLADRALLRAIKLANERTVEQDPKYPLRLLVDIAIRALSPAINDPTTAVQAIDQIEDLLRRLGRHNLDSGYARDADDVIRLIYPMPTWEDYLALAFDEIRQFGAGSVQVMRRLRSALAAVAESMLTPDRADAVQRYLKHLDLAIERSTFDRQDRATAREQDRQGLGLSGPRALPS